MTRGRGGAGEDGGRLTRLAALPTRFNIAQACVFRHPPAAEALTAVAETGSRQVVTFGIVADRAARLARLLLAYGARPTAPDAPGDRVAILLPQSLETAVGHIAAYQAGLIALPLFTLFGEEALRYRLTDSGARFVVTDREQWPKLEAILPSLPEPPKLILVVGASGPLPDRVLAFDDALAQASPLDRVADTAADDPALIIYTSGTTGPPKGALHAHRVLLGHLPGVEWPHGFFPQPGDRFWTPADWAWIGGLLDVLLPAWFHGVPVVARRFAKFDPDAALALMAAERVRNVFFPPTALKVLRQADPKIFDPAGGGLRSIGSGGESLGAELLDWGQRLFGVPINEFYGQTECNLVVGNNAAVQPIRPGSMGKAIPGHRVAVLGPDGAVLPPGSAGEIAVAAPDPVMFLGYWNNPAATAAKFVDGPDGRFLKTGDTGRQDEEGYLFFGGRDDDVITSAGYRIGPGEIEDCLITHPAVAMAAAIGVPDPVRTQTIKAVIVLRDGVEGSDDLARDIQSFVKTKLAAHEYPRLVEFADTLPMTTTGKIMRRALRDAHGPAAGGGDPTAG